MNFWDFANERPALAVVFAALLLAAVYCCARVLRRALTRPPVRIARLEIVIAGNQQPSRVAKAVMAELGHPIIPRAPRVPHIDELIKLDGGDDAA